MQMIYSVSKDGKTVLIAESVSSVSIIVAFIGQRPHAMLREGHQGIPAIAAAVACADSTRSTQMKSMVS